MLPHVAIDISQLGFLARASTLRARGHSQAKIASAVASGMLLRPVRSWVATPKAERDAVIALLHGGMLTGASALGSLGVWRGTDRSIHVGVAANSPGRVSRSAVPLTTFAAPSHLTVGVVKHWGDQHWPVRSLDWRTSVVDALAVFARNAEVESFVAAVDSALHLGVLRPSELPRVFAQLPARFQGARLLVNGKAEAGTESLARLRLSGLGRTIEIQVTIGPYRVDLLIDGWLVIEIDSEEWHSTTRVDDLRKSAWLTARGYRVEHFDYQQVMHEWPTVEHAVREALAQSRPLR